MDGSVRRMRDDSTWSAVAEMRPCSRLIVIEHEQPYGRRKVAVFAVSIDAANKSDSVVRRVLAMSFKPFRMTLKADARLMSSKNEKRFTTSDFMSPSFSRSKEDALLPKSIPLYFPVSDRERRAGKSHIVRGLAIKVQRQQRNDSTLAPARALNPRRRGLCLFGAMDAAIANFPEQRFTLRNGILIIRQHPRN